MNQHHQQQREMMTMPGLSGGGGIVELPYNHSTLSGGGGTPTIDRLYTLSTAAAAAATPATAVVPPPGIIPRRENSNLISINTADRSRSIWRGQPKSTITFKVKTSTYFLEQMGIDPKAAVAAWTEENTKTNSSRKKKGSGDNSSSTKATIADPVTTNNANTAGKPYTLFPSLVDCRTGAVYRHGHNGGMVQLQFADNVVNADGSLASIDAANNTNNLYHVLRATIDRDLFPQSSSGGAGDSFVLEIDAHREGDPEITFGRSPVIHVTNLALSIEEGFSKNPHVHQITGLSDTFAWYSKCGGDKAKLQVYVSIKDEKGRRYNPRSTIPLKTELVYDDGDPAPLKPVAPVKKRLSTAKSKSSKKNATASTCTTAADELSDLPLFRPMEDDSVVLEPDSDSKAFSFRIEEVSFHHPDKVGFKLKVSPSTPQMPYIHPGIMDETIIVLSKPKHKKSEESNNAAKTKRGGRKSILGDLAIDATGSPAKKKARKVSKEDDDGDDEGGLNAVVPLSALIESLMMQGKCLSCNKKVASESFFSERSHKKTCSFRSSLLPSVSLSGVIASGAGCLGGASRSSDGMAESRDDAVKMEVALTAKEENNIFEEQENGRDDAFTSAAVAKVAPTVGLSSPSFAARQNFISSAASAAFPPPLGADYRSTADATSTGAAATTGAGPAPLYSFTQPRVDSVAVPAPLRVTNETNLTMETIIAAGSTHGSGSSVPFATAAASGPSTMHQNLHHYLPGPHAFPTSTFGAYDDPSDSNNSRWAHV